MDWRGGRSGAEAQPRLKVEGFATAYRREEWRSYRERGRRRGKRRGARRGGFGGGRRGDSRAASDARRKRRHIVFSQWVSLSMASAIREQNLKSAEPLRQRRFSLCTIRRSVPCLCTISSRGGRAATVAPARMCA